MKISEVVKNAGLKAFNTCPDKEIRGVYISDMVSDIIGITEGNLLVTLQTHKNLIAAANLVDVAAIVFSRGKTPPDDVVAAAHEARCNRVQHRDGSTLVGHDDRVSDTGQGDAESLLLLVGLDRAVREMLALVK